MSFVVGQTTHAWAQKSKIHSWYQGETTSTSFIAKNSSSENGLALYVTDFQTAGRGRGTNTWLSPEKGTALLCSWTFALDKNPQPVLSCLIGLAVYNAFSVTWPRAAWALKAPNDIYVGAKKLCGILIENVQTDGKNKLVIGIGANILSSSGVDTGTYLAQEVSAEIHSKIWIQFLDRLLLELTLAIINCEEVLSNDQQESLLVALNKFVLLKAPYEKVEANGSLVGREQKINWSEL